MAPETSRTPVKLTASIVSLPSASRQRIELNAKATSARTVYRAIFTSLLKVESKESRVEIEESKIRNPKSKIELTLDSPLSTFPVQFCDGVCNWFPHCAQT